MVGEALLIHLRTLCSADVWCDYYAGTTASQERCSYAMTQSGPLCCCRVVAAGGVVNSCEPSQLSQAMVVGLCLTDPPQNSCT